MKIYADYIIYSKKINLLSHLFGEDLPFLNLLKAKSVNNFKPVSELLRDLIKITVWKVKRQKLFRKTILKISIIKNEK